MTPTQSASRFQRERKRRHRAIIPSFASTHAAGGATRRQPIKRPLRERRSSRVPSRARGSVARLRFFVQATDSLLEEGGSHPKLPNPREGVILLGGSDLDRVIPTWRPLIAMIIKSAFLSFQTACPRGSTSSRPSVRLFVAGILIGSWIFLACGPDTDRQLSEVRALQEAGQFDASIAPLRKLIARESENPEANFRLGVALQQTGRPSLAVWPLQKAASSDEYEIQGGLVLAATLASSRSYEESIRAYNRVLNRDPGNTAGLFGRGRAQLIVGRPAEALKSAEELLGLQPDDQLATTLQGSALLDLERPDEAEAALRGVVARARASNDPNDAARKCAALGLFYRSQDSNPRARETFSNCIADYPLNAELRQHASDFFLAHQDSQGAIDVWKAAVAATPEDLGLRAKLAEILASTERHPSALATLEESVELFDSPEAWRMLASYQRSRGNLSAAREALEASMERSRFVAPSLRFTLADMLIEEGNFEAAAEIADGLEEHSYRSMIRGAILLHQGETAQALEMLDSGLRLYPNNAGARYMAGKAALDLGNSERALSEFREAIRVSETETDASLRLAELYFNMGEFLNARQFANRHITKRPYAEPSAHIISARSSIILNDYESAEGTLNKLRIRIPTEPTAYLEFAELKRKESGPEAALAILTEGNFDLNLPANDAVLRAITQDLLSLGKTAEALETVEAGQRANPDLPGYFDLRGRILLALGKIEEAEGAFSQALEQDPGYAPSLEAQGSMALGSGNLAQALAHFDRAALADPANAQYIYLKAQTHYLLSNTESAQELFRATLEHDSSHVGAHNDLAWLLASEEANLKTALEHAAHAVRLEMNADTLDTLGFVHLQSGSSEEAVRTLGEALKLRPESPSIQFRLGKALAANGDEDLAREMLRKALETSNFPESKAAQAELAKLQGS